MIKLAKEKARALLEFAGKTPVRSPLAQREAMQAYDKIKELLTEEERQFLMEEWKKIRLKDEREGFDVKMKKILQRFWVS
jgi:hypothetical protein